MATKCLRPKDIAELLGVSLSQVYRLIDDGQLEAVRVGRALSVTEAEYERFIAAGGVAA